MHICKKCKHWVSAKTKNHVCGVKTKVNDYRTPVVVPPAPPTYVPSYSTPTLKKEEDTSIEDTIVGAAIGYGLASLFGGSDDSDSSSNNDNDSSSFGGFGGGDFGGGGSDGSW